MTASPVLAHGGDEDTVPDGGVWTPLAAPFASEGEAARSGAIVLSASRMAEGDVAFHARLPGPGWFILAVDEGQNRESALHATPIVMDLYEAVVVFVDPSGSTRVATGTYGFASSVRSLPGFEGKPTRDTNPHAGHSDAWRNGFLTMDPASNPRAWATAAGDPDGSFVVSVGVPEDAARLAPGRVTPVVAFRGTGNALPASPFPGQIADGAGAFLMYPAREGETATDATRAASALRRDVDPVPGLLAAGAVAGAVALGVTAARFGAGGLPGRRCVRAREGVLDAVFTIPRAGRAATAAAVALVMVVSALPIGTADETPPLPPTRVDLPTPKTPRDPCAAGATERVYNVSAIDLEIIYNRWGDKDPEGMMYVLDENIEAVREEAERMEDEDDFPTGDQDSLVTPLALRARLGECLVIRFTNRLLADPPEEPPHPPEVPEGTIALTDTEWAPGSTTVVAGTPVTWQNVGEATHTLAVDGNAFAPVRLGHDETFTFTFNSPGTYTFTCDDVTGERASIRVLPRGSRLPNDPEGPPLPACGATLPTTPVDVPLPEDAVRRASIHVHGLPLDPRADGAGAVGHNQLSAVAPGESIMYRVSAAYEGIFFMHDHGDPTSFGRDAFPTVGKRFRGSNTHGLFGAVIVEPAGATWTHPTTGEPVKSGWKADVHVPGEKSFREFIIFYHDPQIVNKSGFDVKEPMTDHGLNYRVETLSHRLFDDDDRCPSSAAEENNGVNPCEDISMVYSSNVHGDPGTPIPRAYVGDNVKFRLVHAGMEESHVHHLHGHRWRADEGDPTSTRIDSQALSPGETWTQTLELGAGGEGEGNVPGDYIYHCHLFPHLYGGMWGIFRVHDHRESDLRPLPTETPPPEKTPGDPGFPEYMFSQPRGHRAMRAPQEPGVDERTGLTVAEPGAPYRDPCPGNAPERHYRLAAIEVPNRLNGRGDHDPAARIFAFAEDADAVLAGKKKPDPVVLRVRQGECLVVHLENRFPNENHTSDFTQSFLSGLATTERPNVILGFGKVSIHPHLMEFDVLGTDGVSVGWNYDTTIWPGEEITYRYYADHELQTVVWHDHANGLESAMRGTYGATIVEPATADWRNPETGGPVYTKGRDAKDDAFDSVLDARTGKYADVWRADITGPGFKDFREFFASIQDFVPTTRADGVSYRPQECPVCFDDFGLMGFNYKSEPLWHRVHAGTENLFNSRVHGDPATNLWEAYPGDPVVVRFHQVAYEELHTLVLDGHRWRFSHSNPRTQVTDSFSIGVSESFNAYLECGAGGCAHAPGDYLYRGGAVDDYWAGAWGLFRVHDAVKPTLKKLPDHEPAFRGRSVCGPGDPVKWFDVHAIQKETLYNAYGDHDPNGLAYVLSHEVEATKRGQHRPQPLTLRVEEGTCVKIKLTNAIPAGRIPHAHSDPHPTAGWVTPFLNPNVTSGELLAERPYQPGDRVGFRAHLLTSDVRDSGGGRVGFNPDSTVAPGKSRVFTFKADVPAGTTAVVEDLGDVLTNRHHGLFGAIVVVPKGSQVLDPRTGMHHPNLPIADVEAADGRKWRDAVLFQQSGLPLVGADGRPVPIREGHGGDKDAEDAVREALKALDDVHEDGRKLGVAESVRLDARGFVVDGTFNGNAFQAVVTPEGEVASLTVTPPGVPTPAGKGVRVSNARGEPLSDMQLVLERKGGPERAKTDAKGLASFTSPLVPETLSVVRFDGTDCRIPVRAGFEGEFRLHVRANFGEDPDAGAKVTRASSLALEHVKARGFPPAPPGVSGVDVTGGNWRVIVEDALRTYRVTINPVTERVVDFSFVAHAEPSGLPAYLPALDVEQAARRFVETHFGKPPGAASAIARDRFGAWRVEFDDAGSATSLRVDGQTGRVLALVRGPSGGPEAFAPVPSGEVTVRARVDGGVDPEGHLALFMKGGEVLDKTALRVGGRLVLDGALLDRVEERGDIELLFPDLGFAAPIEFDREGHLAVDIGGLLARVNVPAQLAFEQALHHAKDLRGHGAGGDEHADDVHAEDEAHHEEGGGDGGDGWSLVALDLAGDGAWHVSLIQGDQRLDVRVDSGNARVLGVTLRSWESPKDRCSGELLEHLGPHPAPDCPSSFTVADEEDQGLKGFNYRSEPYENRLRRVPDPALVYSSTVHREPATPMIRAYPHDPVTIHLVGVQDKGRVSAFMLGGHVWPQEPNVQGSALRQAQGGMGPFRTFQLDLVGGAGGPAGFDGDYLYQGAVQRFHTEAGEWGILRVHGKKVDDLRRLGESVSGKKEDDGPSDPGSCTFTRNARVAPLVIEVDVVLATDKDGKLKLDTRKEDVRVAVGRLVHVHVTVRDANGALADVQDLRVRTGTSWAHAEHMGPHHACITVHAPEDAAGSRALFTLEADAHGTRLATLFGVKVGPSASNTVPDPDPDETRTPRIPGPGVPGLIAAFLAALVLAGRGRVTGRGGR